MRLPWLMPVSHHVRHLLPFCFRTIVSQKSEYIVKSHNFVEIWWSCCLNPLIELYFATAAWNPIYTGTGPSIELCLYLLFNLPHYSLGVRHIFYIKLALTRQTLKKWQALQMLNFACDISAVRQFCGIFTNIEAVIVRDGMLLHYHKVYLGIFFLDQPIFQQIATTWLTTSLSVITLNPFIQSLRNCYNRFVTKQSRLGLFCQSISTY